MQMEMVVNTLRNLNQALALYVLVLHEPRPHITSF